MSDPIEGIDSNKCIRVLIIEDHPVAADGMRTYLATDDSIQVVGICTRGDDAERMVRQLQPDVIILDLELSGSSINGVELTHRLRNANSAVRILTVTAWHDEAHVLPALKAGVCGYVLKTSSQTELLQAVHAVAANQKVFDPKVMEIVARYLEPVFSELTFAHDGDGSDLTDRELEVLELIAAGKTNEQIARALSIGEKTVKTHVSNILSKLHLRNREQAALWYNMRHRPK